MAVKVQRPEARRLAAVDAALLRRDPEREFLSDPLEDEHGCGGLFDVYIGMQEITEIEGLSVFVYIDVYM